MVKRTQLPRKKPSSAPPSLDLAEDVLQAGVENEEAGEKWRAGDAAKSLRFFLRAIEQYESGLRTFPDSFDLAYNKARLLFDLTQQPRFHRLLPSPASVLLEEAVRCHEAALKLEPHNTDALFNAAQAVTSLVDSKIDAGFDDGSLDGLLHKAIDLLDRCLCLQRQQYEQQQQQGSSSVGASSQAEEHDLGEEDDGMETGEQASDATVWATLFRPITPEDLADTSIAKVETLKAMTTRQNSGSPNELDAISSAYQQAVGDLSSLSESQDLACEIEFAKSSFLFAYAAAQYRLGLIDETNYDSNFERAQAPLQNALNGDTAVARVLCMCAEAHVEVNTTLAEAFDPSSRLHNKSTEQVEAASRIRWKHLSTAQDQYTRASKLPDVQDLAQIHILRGDTELLRARLADAPAAFDKAIKSRATLLKNAKVFYSAASRVLEQSLSANDPLLQEARFEAKAKVAVVTAVVEDQPGVLTNFVQSHALNETINIVNEMRDNDLIDHDVYSQFQQLLS